MRMRLRRTYGEEDGAVLIIVVLCMIVMLAFSALVVDVGGLLVTRRRMVRASDAAALAAAQSCATATLSDAETQADRFASANQTPKKSGAVTRRSFLQEGCGSASSGSVTVEYAIDQQTFFAPVLGLPDGYSVPAKARAIWGPAGSGSLPPLMVSSEILNGDCDIPDASPGTDCNFWYSKEDLGASTWGWLSLYTVDDPGPGGAVGWDVTPSATCPNVGADQRDKWLKTPTIVPALNFPDPTYVCADTGLTEANWKALKDLLPIELQFPVNDPDTQVDKGGNLTSDKPDKYNIVGFVTLLVTALYHGDDPLVAGTPPTAGTPAQVRGCPVQPDPIDFTAAQPTYDLSPDIAACEAMVGEPVIEPPTKEQANKWAYDLVTNVVTWTSNFSGRNSQDVQIILEYLQPALPGSPGEPGLCGEQFDGKHQDKCLVTEWVGFTTDGGEPGGGEDFGNRPVRLDE